MRQHKDKAIILSRVDYAEKDRILTVLCKQQGTVSLLAKGVRSEKSRLAGGIELLSDSDINFVEGKTNLMTLTAARLVVHYGELTKNIQRMQQAFDHIKTVNTVADEGGGQEFCDILLGAMSALNDDSYDPRLIDIWFSLRILEVSGSVPNLALDADTEINSFNFNYDAQQFVPVEGGAFSRNDLKLLRLCISQAKPPKIQNKLGSEERLQALTRLLLKTNVTEV